MFVRALRRVCSSSSSVGPSRCATDVSLRKVTRSHFLCAEDLKASHDSPLRDFVPGFCYFNSPRVSLFAPTEQISCWSKWLERSINMWQTSCIHYFGVWNWTKKNNVYCWVLQQFQHGMLSNDFSCLFFALADFLCGFLCLNVKCFQVEITCLILKQHIETAAPLSALLTHSFRFLTSTSMYVIISNGQVAFICAREDSIMS